MNWAIQSENVTHYLEGDRAATAEAAEKEWRRILGVYFIPVAAVRRTTSDEDARLAD